MLTHFRRVCEARGAAWVYVDDLVFIGIVCAIVVVAIIVINAILRRVIHEVHSRKAAQETEQRAKTFVGVFRGLFITAALFLGLLAVMRWYKVDLTPFLASAGIAGVIVGFGAQSLIKDVLAGFFILMEDQFAVGDVVEICGVSGDVEAMTLRTTVLRDMNGCAHIVPNGQIGVVTNYTRGWSRVDLKIAISRDEDADRVIAVLKEELERFAAEPAWSAKLDGEPRVLGMDVFDEHSFTIRLLIRTRPGEQWGVRREFRKRVKTRFDAEDIRAPFPYRVVTGGPTFASAKTRRH